MNSGRVTTVLLALLAVSFVVVGSYSAVTEHQFKQQCQEEATESTIAYADCEDFVYVVGLYGGSAVAVAGVGSLVVIVWLRTELAPGDTSGE